MKECGLMKESGDDHGSRRRDYCPNILWGGGALHNNTGHFPLDSDLALAN